MVGVLVVLQSAEGLTDVEMGRIVGVDRSTWSRVRRGELGLSWPMFLAALRWRPGLKDVAVEEAMTSREVASREVASVVS